MKKYDLKFSILIPTYKGAEIIGETLKSILLQSFDNYEIIIQEDASGDNIEEVVKLFKDKRIKFFCNKRNLSYAINLEAARKNATGDIIYLMGQDDILGKDALLNTYKAFKRSTDIGAVTRPYFWFDLDIEKPVRAKEQMSKTRDTIVRITDDPQKIIRVFQTLDQLSGLAYRVKFMDIPFHPDCFPCHIYPFASIFKNHPVVFLKDYNIAVRIATSQTRFISSIYEKSPMQSWVQMFDNVFAEKRLQKIKKICIKDFVARNYIGLVQLRNYARFRCFTREIGFLLKYRWQNIVSPGFWFYSLGCIIVPPVLLIPMVDWYKNSLNAKRLKKKNIRFKYAL